MCLNIRVDNSAAPLKNFSFTPDRCSDVSAYAANLLNAAADDAGARMLQPFAPSGCPNPLTLRVRCSRALVCPRTRIAGRQLSVPCLSALVGHTQPCMYLVWTSVD